MSVGVGPLRKCGIQQTAQPLIESCDLYQSPGGGRWYLYMEQGWQAVASWFESWYLEGGGIKIFKK